jgi:basic amino acid/polyamine antiporter, APA family
MELTSQTNRDPSKLPRFLGPVGATLFVVCFTIGTAIFLVPGIVARNAGSIPATLLAWCAGGLISLCGALCYAELAVRLPKSGAEYRYLYAGYGPMVAFAFAWTCLFAQPIAIAAVARGFADYLSELLPMTDALRRATAAGAIALFAALAIRSTPAATRFAGIAATGKLLALLAIAGIGIWVGSRAGPAAAVASASIWHWTQLPSAMIAVIFAYDGVSSIASIAGEVRNPQRTLPISLVTSIAIIATVYVLVNLIYFRVLGFEGVAGSGAVASAALKTGIGPSGAVVIAVMVMASALGTVAAQMVGNPRFFVGPAEDGLFPAQLATVSPRTLTPVNAILLTATIAIGLVTLGSYGLLLRLYVLSYYPFVVVALLAAVRLRQRQGNPQGFAMPLYPLPLLLYGFSVFGICTASALDDPKAAICGLLIPLSGLITYSLRQRIRLRRADAGSSTANRQSP